MALVQPFGGFVHLLSHDMCLLKAQQIRLGQHRMGCIQFIQVFFGCSITKCGDVLYEDSNVVLGPYFCLKGTVDPWFGV